MGQAKKKAKIAAGDDIRHPFNEIKGKKNILDDDTSLKLCMSYLSHLGTKTCISNNRPTNCTCMIDLASQHDMLVSAATLMCAQAERKK